MTSMYPNRIIFYAPMSRQRETKTRRRPPWVSGTGNQSQHIGELYPDTSRMVACSDTTQQLRTEGVYQSHHEPEPG